MMRVMRERRREMKCGIWVRVNIKHFRPCKDISVPLMINDWLREHKQMWRVR